MRIYIRTPLVNKSDIIPHTVEHCVGNIGWKRTDYFDYYRWFLWEIRTEYTYFEFDRWIKYDYLLQKLFQPIEKDTVDYEHKVLKEELWDPSYCSEIYEKIIRKFIDPKFLTNHYKPVSLDDVKRYHKKYYKIENLVVVDEEKWYNVIFKWFEPEKRKYKKLEKRKEKFIFRKNKYILNIFSHYNADQYRKWFFSYRILNCYCYYINRLHKQWYYNQENYFFQYSDSFIITLENLDYSKLNQEFFKQWKRYFLNILKYWYFQERFFLNEYFYWIPKARKEVIQMCKNFTRGEFKELLELK